MTPDPQQDHLQLSVADMGNVRHVAQILARVDGHRAVLAVGNSLYDDPYLLEMLETGLVVTYVRSFASAKGKGNQPLPDEWVPEEHRALHDFLVKRRSKHSAHIDATAPLSHKRRVVPDPNPGWIQIWQPSALTREQLLELAELAEKLRRICQDRLAGLTGANSAG